MNELLIVAGEASGDLHGARLLTELKQLSPDLHAFGLGGDELRQAGFEALADSSEIAVVGLTEALKILPRARQIFDLLLAEVQRRDCRTALLIDSPDFNLRLAKKLRAAGVRVVYYISPQLWAWRKRRIKNVRRDVDTMLVLFPFEAEFYRQQGVEAVHVGHPLVDEVPVLPQAWEHESLSADEPIRLALLPGSRRSEVRALLPAMLDTVRQMQRHRQVAARLIQAPTVPAELFDDLIEAAGVEVERVRSQRFPAIANCHLALCASGTATLEVALLGTPMLVLYRLKWSTYQVARWLVDLPYFCMVNLVLGREVVPELVQAETEPSQVAARALELVGDAQAVANMRADMALLRPALGEHGASQRAASAVFDILEVADHG